jgi:hypothetical protein
MTVTFPVLAVAAMLVLSLAARELKYFLTSTSLLVMAGALALWLAAVVFVLG